MPHENPFTRIAETYAGTSGAERRAWLSKAIGDTIPFVATAGCTIETYTPTRVVVRLDDREAVHNHIGGMHAAAMALLAETATGLVVALNLTPPAVPLLRTLTMDFQRMAEGSVRAEATLPEEAAARLRERPIGKIDVSVECADASHQTPVAGTLQWAWVPKDRLR
jgi:acyl-coenzyme A thioesterase PaaI-like protein